jgi:hypothetical protein
MNLVDFLNTGESEPSVTFHRVPKEKPQKMICPGNLPARPCVCECSHARPHNFKSTCKGRHAAHGLGAGYGYLAAGERDRSVRISCWDFCVPYKPKKKRNPIKRKTRYDILKLENRTEQRLRGRQGKECGATRLDQTNVSCPECGSTDVTR